MSLRFQLTFYHSIYYTSLFFVKNDSSLVCFHLLVQVNKNWTKTRFVKNIIKRKLFFFEKLDIKSDSPKI